MFENNKLLRFARYLKYTKKEYIIGILAIIIGIVTEILGVKIISKLFDLEFLTNHKDELFKYIMILGTIYLILRLIDVIKDYARRYYFSKTSQIMYKKLQEEVYDHIQKLPIKYFDNIPAGSVLSRLVSDVNAIRKFFESTFVLMIIVVLKIVIIYGILLFINVKLAIFILLYIPLIYVIQKIYTKLSVKYYGIYRKVDSKLQGNTNETFQNLEIIKVFNKEEDVYNNWKEMSGNRLKSANKSELVNSFLMFKLFEFIELIIKITIILYYVYSLYYNLNLIKSAEVVMFLFYVSSILGEIMQLTSQISQYNKAKVSAMNLSEILDLEIEKNTGTRILDNFEGVIKFENVGFSYNDKEQVLKGISFEVGKNQTIAFVGHTGSGKSTIMNLLIKFYENQTGNIYVSGENLKELDNEYLRSNISIVMQDSFLFEGTLLTNISEDREKTKKALEIVGADHILSERGLDAEVTVNGDNFSTGEKQLISFARALAKDPKILILDEATANIDSQTEKIIQRGIEALKEGRTTLIIAHRLSTIRNADKIIVLDKGNIVESGNHEELVALNGVYKKMLERDMNNE
ncbi:ABC transporter ATP-binding protein [Pseudostreptobacillus hongkongensis]|uniref:ABC transporter ATP-binding protein n=1 Tax=Pseudostreptobacillus hongkongensis TaxID=1162717 RepID=UPI00082C0EAC|nr:ABC transporter ATP-binding protein [Pseudostreptobacillus hongkongensis]